MGTSLKGTVSPSPLACGEKQAFQSCEDNSTYKDGVDCWFALTTVRAYKGTITDSGQVMSSSG